MSLAFAMFGGIALAVLIAASRRSARRPTPGLRSAVRHRPYDDPGCPGGPVGGAGALCRRAPGGLQVGGADIDSGPRPVLAGLRSGRLPQAVTVTLSAACDVSGAQEVPSDQPGTRRFERPLSLQPAVHGLRFYTFPGGCATYKFNFAARQSPLLAIPVDSAVTFMSRAKLVDYIRSTEGLALCGRGAPCPG